MQKRWAAVLPWSFRICFRMKQSSQYVSIVSSISFIIESLFKLSLLKKIAFVYFTTQLNLIPILVILAKDILSGIAVRKLPLYQNYISWTKDLSYPIFRKTTAKTLAEACEDKCLCDEVLSTKGARFLKLRSYRDIVFAVLLHIFGEFTSDRRGSGLGGAIRRVFFSAYCGNPVHSAKAKYKCRFFNSFYIKTAQPFLYELRCFWFD